MRSDLVVGHLQNACNVIRIDVTHSHQFERRTLRSLVAPPLPQLRGDGNEGILEYTPGTSVDQQPFRVALRSVAERLGRRRALHTPLPIRTAASTSAFGGFDIVVGSAAPNRGVAAQRAHLISNRMLPGLPVVGR